jgi:hypothetical protein
MTLCVGWVDAEAVYLTADSAVTVAPRELNSEYSSFGEKQPANSIGNVEESALKILRHQNTAAAFAGDASPINDLFSNYINASRIWSPREAFKNAWISSHDGRDLEALFAFYDGAGPHLVKYDAANIAGAEVTSACIGNLFVGDKEYIRSVLQRMPHKADVTDRLVCGVCISQRLAILANVMETHGIGGVVAAAQ